MEWLTAFSADVVKVAEPPLSGTGDPSCVTPSMKTTVPVGVPKAPVSGVTVAVNVTACPYTDGLRFDEIVVVVWRELTLVMVTVATFESGLNGVVASNGPSFA